MVAWTYRCVTAALGVALFCGCGSDLTCGDGTEEAGDRCEAVAAGVKCGAGTMRAGDACVLADDRCGEGTRLDGEQCVLAETSCAAGTHLEAGQCVVDGARVACGAGTKLVDGSCVPADPLSCGDGTSALDGECVPDSALVCGTGTVEKDGRCVPENPLECGAGTSEDNGSCVPDIECGPGTMLDAGVCVPENPLSCGPGTVSEGGECVPDLAASPCGPGTALVDDHCEAADFVWLSLPFASGFAAKVTQGFDGYLSHSGDSAEALDFDVPEGTSVRAARSGLVVDLREDSSTGCGDESCADQANYVVLDHGDGTRTRYYHLQQNGVLVDIGDVVCAGQPIGLSGNTGFSTGPHLHLDAINLWSYTLPLRFHELEAQSDGVALVYQTFTSENELTTCAGAGTPSDFPENTFETRGVLLDPGVPCDYAKRNMPYTVSGRVTGAGQSVVIALWSTSGSWIYHCAVVDSAHRFSTTVTWDSATFPSYSGIHITEADDAECGTYPGWHSSARLTLVD